MIDVGMRADDGARFQTMPPQNLQNAINFIAGIDDEGFARFRIAEDRAIALQETDRDDFVDELLGGHHRRVYRGIASAKISEGS